MQYRLRTLLILIVPIAVGLAWWRDRSQLSSRLALREEQIRVLQRDLAIERQLGVPIFTGFRFKTASEMIEYINTCATDDDFQREAWGNFGNSDVVDGAVGQLVDVLGSSNEAKRYFTVFLVGEIGHKKRPLDFDPVPALIGLLDDPSLRVRANTYSAIGKFGSLAKSTLPRLREIMRRDLSHDAFLATLAVKEVDASEEIGTRLRELFFSNEQGVRCNVAHSIPDHVPANEARDFLMAEYERATDKVVRECIAEAMNKIKE
jgi:hypothetical protein